MRKAAVLLLLALLMVSALSAMDVANYYVKTKVGTFKAGDMLEMADMDYGVRFSASAGICWRNCCFLELSAGHVSIDGGAATAFVSRKWDQQDIMLTAGLVIGLAGGILMSALFSKGEPGWGILGIGISVLGVFLLIFGVLRIIGYLHLKKRRFSGFILVFICEAFAFLGGLFSFIMGNFFMAAIPFIWSVIVLVYLVKERYSFFHDSESEEKK